MNKYLLKIASVAGPVKAYRRAYQTISEGQHAWHSTSKKGLSGILSDKSINPGTRRNYFGKGVYMNDVAPANGYEVGGVGIADAALGVHKKDLSLSRVGPDNGYLKSETSIPLHSKSLAILKDKPSGELQQKIRDARVRTIPAHVWDEAKMLHDYHSGKFD